MQNCLKLNLLASDLTSFLSFSWYEWHEQAKKALESALGGNKEKFEKWNQEIKKREEVGGGGGAGGGGWFGWGGRFGWSHGDNFWQEAQQTILTLLGIIVLVRNSLYSGDGLIISWVSRSPGSAGAYLVLHVCCSTL